MVIKQNIQILFVIIIFFSLFTSFYEKKLFLNDNIITNENEKLLFVWEHFRHGAREPYTQINKTTWIDYIGVQWKSEGELNSLGLRAHYLLGTATKNRYKEFLSQSFDTNEIFIISTDSNRTIVSAMSNLQGIYHNYTTPNLTQNQIKHAKISGLNQTYKEKIDEMINKLNNSYVKDGASIMPIHVFSKVGFQFLLNSASYCPQSTIYKKEAQEQEKVKEIVENFINVTNNTYGEYIFKFMNVSSELNPKYLYDNNSLNYICDTYIADYVFGRDMPHINNTGIDMDKFYEHCLNYSIIDLYYISYGLPPTKLAYLTVSPMFITIFNYMDRRIKLNEKNNTNKLDPSSPKFVIYSGHDSTVSAMDVFLKAEFNIEYENPVYTTSQLFELWQNKSGYFIKYLYNHKEKAIYELNNFKEKINKVIFSENEINEFCGISDEHYIEQRSLYETIFYIICGIVFILILLLISLYILNRKKM